MHECLVTQSRYWSVPGARDLQWNDIHAADVSVYPPRFTRSGPSRVLDRFRFPVSCQQVASVGLHRDCFPKIGDKPSSSSCEPVTDPTACP